MQNSTNAKMPASNYKLCTKKTFSCNCPACLKLSCTRTNLVLNLSSRSDRFMALSAEIRGFRSIANPLPLTRPLGRKSRCLHRLCHASTMKGRKILTRPAPPKQKSPLGRIWPSSPSCSAANAVLADWHGVQPSQRRLASASSAQFEGVFGVDVLRTGDWTQDRGPAQKDGAADLTDIPPHILSLAEFRPASTPRPARRLAVEEP